MDDTLKRLLKEQGHNYFRVIKQGVPKTEFIIVTLECYKCGCIVEADAEKLAKDKDGCRITYSCICPCCKDTMFHSDVRTELV